jgi:hypothetical protein
MPFLSRVLFAWHAYFMSCTGRCELKASVCSASHLHVDGQTLILLTAPTMIQDPLSGQGTAYLRRGHIPKAQSLPTEAAELHSEEMADIRSLNC